MCWIKILLIKFNVCSKTVWGIWHVIPLCTLQMCKVSFGFTLSILFMYFLRHACNLSPVRIRKRRKNSRQWKLTSTKEKRYVPYNCWVIWQFCCSYHYQLSHKWCQSICKARIYNVMGIYDFHMLPAALLYLSLQPFNQSKCIYVDFSSLFITTA
jgi:hypothetical protein